MRSPPIILLLRSPARSELQARWRSLSRELLLLANCRALWGRFVERHRRDVDEAVEKLKVGRMPRSVLIPVLHLI